MSEAAPEAPRKRPPFLVVLPLIVFAALAALFFVRLGAGDAHRIPSALIGKPAPAFALPALEGVQEVVISEEVVNGNARPLYIYAEREKEKKGA